MRISNFITFAAIIVLLSSCEKENNNEIKDQTRSDSFAQVSGEKGSKLTLVSPDGSRQDISTDFMVDWSSGQLLNSNYYRLFRVGSDEGTLFFWLNIPNDVKFRDIIEGEHTLQNRVPLQNTQNLDEVVPELYIPGANSRFEDEATGTVTIYLTQQVDTIQYDMIGVVNANFVSDQRENYKIEGAFWIMNSSAF